MAKLTRRNTIIGMGALVGGAGALAASGAFTTVEAQRTVDIETAGDANALIGLAPGDTAELVDDGGDVIEIAEDSINLRARTRFDDELAVTNNSGQAVSLDILNDFENDGGGSLVETNRVFTFEVNGSESDTGYSDSSDLSSVGNGDTVVFDIKIDFRDSFIDDIDTGNYSNPAPTNTTSPVNFTDDANDFLENDLGNGDNYIVIEANDAS